MVESRPSKPLVAGSSPVSRSIEAKRVVGPRSSVVEHVLGKDGVTSSSLVVGSIDTIRKTGGHVTSRALKAQKYEREAEWPRKSSSGRSRT